MIQLCAGQASERHLDAMLLLAHQLDQSGHKVRIDQRFIPEDVTRQFKFEMAPYVADATLIKPSVILVLGAEHISDEAQSLLGQIDADAEVPVWALGYFRQLQDQIQAQNRIAYAMGREPQVHDLLGVKSPPFYDGAVAPLVTPIVKRPVQSSQKLTRVLVYLPFDEEKEAEEIEAFLGHLSALHFSPTLQLHILTTSKGKSVIGKTRSFWSSVFGYMELPPLSLLKYFDVAVFLGSDVPGQRMAALAVHAMGAGKVVVDCTDTGAFAASGAPVVRGPADPHALVPYLCETVVPNRIELGRRTLRSSWLAARDLAQLESNLRLPRPKSKSPDHTPRRLFFPTNGNGLGHAQRCALVADERGDDEKPLFAAFPSCVAFLRSRGFSCLPMVSRSAEHEDEYAADLLNYVRLRNVLQKGDHLVFDGGYVFDSVYRTVSELDLSATWIRRGLWRSAQIKQSAIERERAFTNVIVPIEAFAELNTSYSQGDHVQSVGPIVQNRKWTDADTHRLRDQLGTAFDRKIDTLVISMLGGGVASSRTAQTQLLCSLFEDRDNFLHLSLAWPHAEVDRALYGWKNSFVVRTSHAIDFCRAADLCVSAAGYNSFHELMYAKVPAIFIPQYAPYLDDQERRARAAEQRALAVCLDENELFKLEREALSFIDGGKGEVLRAALDKEVFPEPGNAQAANLIREAMAT